MSKTKTYTIGGQDYDLLPMVLGVLYDLVRIGANVLGSAGKAAHWNEVLAAMGPRRGMFLAAMLTPKGVHPKDRDLEAMGEEITWGCSGTLAEEIAGDFFAQGDAVRELEGMTVSLVRTMGALVVPSGGASSSSSPSGPSASSPEATSSSETASSGASPGRRSANTSNTGKGK